MYVIKFDTPDAESRYVAHPGGRAALRAQRLSAARESGLLTLTREKAFGFPTESAANRFVGELLLLDGWVAATLSGELRPGVIEIADPPVPSRMPEGLGDGSRVRAERAREGPGVTLEQVQALLAEEGYQSRVHDGRVISSTGGTTFQVLLYGLDESTGRASSCQLVAAFRTTRPADEMQREVAEWNRKNRFPKAFVQGELLIASLDFLCVAAPARAQIAAHLELWSATLRMLVGSGLAR